MQDLSSSSPCSCHVPVKASFEESFVLPVEHVGAPLAEGWEVDHVLDEDSELVGAAQHGPGGTQGQLILRQGAPGLDNSRVE